MKARESRVHSSEHFAKLHKESLVLEQILSDVPEQQLHERSERYCNRASDLPMKHIEGLYVQVGQLGG